MPCHHTGHDRHHIHNIQIRDSRREQKPCHVCGMTIAIIKRPSERRTAQGSTMGVAVTCIHTQVDAQHESSLPLTMLMSYAAATDRARAVEILRRPQALCLSPTRLPLSPQRRRTNSSSCAPTAYASINSLESRGWQDAGVFHMQ